MSLTNNLSGICLLTPHSEWRGAKVAIKVNNQITDVDGFLAEAKLTLYKSND